MGKIADISKWQGQVDFAKAKSELDLVIIRTQAGSTYEDPLHKIDEANAIHYGIPFGVYAYAKYINVADARQEALDFINRADKDCLFYVVDVEEMTLTNPADVVPATQAFIDFVKERTGKKVGLYTGHSFYKEHNMGAVKADFLWIPRYPSADNGVNVVKPDFASELHQFTQCGSLAGVAGHVDLSRLNGDKPLSFFTGQAPIQLVEPAPKPVVVAPKPVVAQPAPKPTPAPVGKKIFLSADNETWTVYKMGHPLVKSNPANVAGQLAPKKFGGLTYDIKATTAPDCYVIHTDSFGDVQIYGAPSTGAKIIDATPTPAPQPKPVEAPKPVVAKPVAPKVTTHKVVSGDTLSELAVKYNTSVSNLKALNGLSSDVIQLGQVLKVNGSAPAPKPAPQPTYVSYKIVAGDNLTKIAQNHHSTVDAIVKLNGLPSANKIKIGQVIRVPR